MNIQQVVLIKNKYFKVESVEDAYTNSTRPISLLSQLLLNKEFPL